jgi:hypothetical protein
MNTSEIERTVEIAALFRELYCNKNPDCKAVCLALLGLLELHDFGQELQQLRQDWKALVPCLLKSPDIAKLHDRCFSVMTAIAQHPRCTYELISNATNYSEQTVRQTVNSLIQGGVPINQETVGKAGNGRPKVVLSLSTWRGSIHQGVN